MNITQINSIEYQTTTNIHDSCEHYLPASKDNESNATEKKLYQPPTLTLLNNHNIEGGSYTFQAENTHNGLWQTNS